MRKIIQIACEPARLDNSDDTIECNLYAVCDDGTVWFLNLYGGENAKWEPATDWFVPLIPQDSKE